MHEFLPWCSGSASEINQSINQSINHLFVKASKMTVTKVSVQDQQGSESAYSDPKTKPKYVEKYTKYKHKIQTVRSNHKKPIIVP